MKTVKWKKIVCTAVALAVLIAMVPIRAGSVSAATTGSNVKTPVLKAVTRSGTSIQLRWNKIKGASGYLIYGYDNEDGAYYHLDTVSGKKKSYNDTGLSKNKQYTYKIRAFKKKKNGRKVWSKASEKATAWTGFARKGAVYVYEESTGPTAISLTWSMTDYGDRMSGFAVYKSGSKNGKYKKVKEVPWSAMKYRKPYQWMRGGYYSAWKDTAVTAGKTYYYKVRAFKKFKGKKFYGIYDNVNATALYSKPKTTAVCTDRTDGTDGDSMTVKITSDRYNKKMIIDSANCTCIKEFKTGGKVKEAYEVSTEIVGFTAGGIALSPGETITLQLKAPSSFVFYSGSKLDLSTDYGGDPQQTEIEMQ